MRQEQTIIREFLSDFSSKFEQKFDSKKASQYEIQANKSTFTSKIYSPEIELSTNPKKIKTKKNCREKDLLPDEFGGSNLHSISTNAQLSGVLKIGREN